MVIPETVKVPSNGALLGLRILLSSFLLLGFVQGLAIVKTLMRYGSAMDRSWEEKINKLILETASPAHGGFAPRPSGGTTFGEEKSRWRMQYSGTTRNDARSTVPDYPPWRPSDSRPTGFAAPWEPSPFQPKPWSSWNTGAAKRTLVGGYPAFEADQETSLYTRPKDSAEFARAGRLSPSTKEKRKKLRQAARRRSRTDSSESDREITVSRAPEDSVPPRSRDRRRNTRRQREDFVDEPWFRHDGQGLDKEGEKVEPTGSRTDRTSMHMGSAAVASGRDPVQLSHVSDDWY